LDERRNLPHLEAGRAAEVSPLRIAARGFAVRYADEPDGEAGVIYTILSHFTGTLSPLCAFYLRGVVPMKVFDHTPTEVRHGHSYPMTAPNHTATWIAGLVGLAVVIGVFAHEYGSWRTRPNVANPTQEMTQPPPVNPAPPEPAKP
jgi:hypothetical protein